MSSSQSKEGVLLLASKIIDDSAALSSTDFARWGEDTCVPSVQATGGISRTLRYESLTFLQQHRSTGQSGGAKAVPENINFPYDFLDVYFLPDLDFRESEDFRQLPIIGDAEMTANLDASKLLERLLMQTVFNIKFCERTDDDGSSSSTAVPAPFLVTITSAAQISLPKDIGGKVMGRYSVRSGYTYTDLERLDLLANPNDELMLVGCNSIRKVVELLGSLETPPKEVGVWGLKREYDGSERKAASWRPNIRI